MRFLFLFCFCLCRHAATAQPLPAIKVTDYHGTAGTNYGKVTCLLQGSSGYLWVGTSNGLLRFDGYAFRHITDTVLSNTVTRLAEDRSGNLWMSLLGGGLVRYQPLTGRFKKYLVQTADASLATAETEMLYFDKNNQLWLGLTQKGLIKADPERGRFEQFDMVDQKRSAYPVVLRKVYNTVYGAATDADGNMWLATHDGLYRFRPQTGDREAVRTASLQQGGQRYDLFGSIIYANDTLWLSAWAGGLSRYAIRTGNWKTWLPGNEKSNGMRGNIITSLQPKNSTEFWCTTSDFGLATFNRRTEAFTFFGKNPGYASIAGGEWMRLVVDKQGAAWALRNENLVKVEVPQPRFLFTPLPVEERWQGGNIFIADRWENDAVELTATQGARGLYVHDKKTGRTVALPVAWLPGEDKGSDLRQLFADSRGKLWVLSRDFLYSYDFQKAALVKEAQPPLYTKARPSNSFVHMAEDRQGNLWIATRRNGVFLYHTLAKTFTHYGSDSASLPSLPSYYIAENVSDAKGRIWLCSPYGFLGYIRPEAGTVHNLADDKAIAPAIKGGQSFSLCTDKEGSVWAGTYFGLCYFDCRGERPVLKKILKAADGLRSNLVGSVAEDRTGNIWCLTDAALCRVRKSDFFVSSFDGSDGIDWSGPAPKLRLGPAGLELLGAKGYYRFLPETFYRQEAAPPLVITAMTVNDKDFFFNEELTQKGRVELSPSQNVFSFEFAALDFMQPGRHSYAYMLEGFDKDWIASGARRFASYTALPGGDYTFKVKTSDGQHLSMPLFIATPFYRTFPFFAALALLVAAITYFYYRGRIAHHREVFALHAKTQTLQKEKAGVMYDALKQQLNPHFLFNSLSSLSSLIGKDDKLANHFVEQLSKVYRYILQNRDKDLVSLGDELKFVNSYVQLQQTRFKQGLRVNVNVGGEHCHGKVVPVVLQNLIENAIKHNSTSADSPLVIRISCADDYLIVENNLQKREAVETSNKQGLLSLKALYGYYTPQPVIVTETADVFIIKIPLL